MSCWQSYCPAHGHKVSRTARYAGQIPSDLSDFNLYGGIYRYVNLVYTPVLSVDKLFATAEVDAAGKMGKLTLKARFYNPPQAGNAEKAGNAETVIKLTDPNGKTVQQVSVNLKNLVGDVGLTTLELKKPVLWSVDQPLLYTVELTVKQGGQEYKTTEKIGFRNFEFVDYGPFKLNGKRLLLRGTHRHEDHAGVAQAMTEDMYR